MSLRLGGERAVERTERGSPKSSSFTFRRMVPNGAIWQITHGKMYERVESKCSGMSANYIFNSSHKLYPLMSKHQNLFWLFLNPSHYQNLRNMTSNSHKKTRWIPSTWKTNTFYQHVWDQVILDFIIPEFLANEPVAVAFGNPPGSTWGGKN